MYSKVIRPIFLLLSAFIIVQSLNAQYSISTGCTGGEMMVSTILANAVDGSGDPIPKADQTGGTFTTISSFLTVTPNSENGIISALPGSGSFSLVWEANGNSYIITINNSGTGSIPAVTAFTADNPSNCGSSYDADATVTITAGGTAPYSYVINGTAPVASYTGTLASAGSSSITIVSGLIADNDMTLQYVADNTGCLSTNTPITTSYVLADAPVAQNVTWGSSCSGDAGSIQLNNSENGITYQLKLDGAVVETWVSTGGSHTFTTTLSTAGTYEIVAIDPCDGTTEIAMNGGAHVVYDSSDPIVAQTLTIDSSPVCTESSSIITLSDSQDGTTYTLYDPDDDVIQVITGDGNAISFAATTLIEGDYYVQASNACGGPIDMSNTITVNALPVYNGKITFSPSDAVCASDASGLTIKVNSQGKQFTYQLYLDETLLDEITGVNAAIWWKNLTGAGTYSVLAKDNTTGCSVLLAETATILPYDAPLQTTGTVCGSAVVSISPTVTGTSYTLYRDGVSTGQTLNGVDDATLSFSTQTVEGEYTVIATNGACTDEMTGSLTLVAYPTVLDLAVNKLAYCTSGTSDVTLSLSGIESGVNYQLQIYDDATSTWSDSGSILTGTDGSTISWNNVTEGTYQVVASKSASCSITMNNSFTIEAVDPLVGALVTTGIVCPKGTVSITPTENGATYTLWRDGAFVQSKVEVNDDDFLTFGEKTDAGVYTVTVSSTGGCASSITGELEVQSTPTVLNLLVNKTKYCASEPLSDVNFSIGPVQDDVSYQLQTYDSGTSSWVDEGGVQIGVAGTTLTWADQLAGTYRVVASNDGGCTVTMTNSYTISEVDTPTATLTAQSPVRKCEGDATLFKVIVTFTGNPPYSFDLVDDKGNTIANETSWSSSTYSIWVDPTASETTYSIENLTDVGSCTAVTGSSTATVYIDPLPTITFDPTNPEVCEGSTISVTADGAGTGGTYTWSDGLGTGATVTVGPNVPGKNYTVIAETSLGCSSSNSVYVTVNSLPTVDWVTASGIYEYCENDAVVTLDGSPDGGSFSGTGVIGDQFDPSAASIGTNTITYLYTDANSCTNSATKNITVNDLPVVSITNLQTTYCADAGTVTINGSPDGTSVGSIGTFDVVGYTGSKGTWWNSTNGTLTLNVGSAIAALGAPKTLTIEYSYTDPEGCTQTVQETTTLLEPVSNNLDFTNITATCEDALDETLIAYYSGVAITPDPNISFSFSGPGITDNGDGTATFSPSAAGSGTHTISFTYTDANGCSDTYTETVTLGTPLSITGLGTEYCSAQTTGIRLVGLVNGATPSPDNTTFDVIYVSTNAPVVTSAGNNTYDFVPSTLFAAYGDGEYDIVYHYNDGGCDNTTTTTVTIVESLDPSFIIDGGSGRTNFCLNDSPIALAPAITLPATAGSTFSGNGVGGNYFVPSDSNVDYHPTANTITHTIRNIVNGLTCITSTTRDVYVTPVDVSISGLSSSYCTNDNTITISVNGDDASDGVATFSATKNGNTVNDFLTDSDLTDNQATIDPSVGDGVYEVTMSFEKTSDGCETTVTETVTVYAANPVTFSGVSDGDIICKSSADITLRGDMPSGGVGNFTESVTNKISNTGTDDLGNAVVTDDGVAILKPSEMNIGTYVIEYIYTNANGCETSKTKTIEIVSAPSDLYSVTGGGAYCDDDANPGVTIGLSGSNSGVTYVLLKGGVPTSVTYTGDGTAFTFTDSGDATGTDLLFTDEGYYTVSANTASGCNAIMTGSVLVEQYELVLQEVSHTDVTCIGADDGTVTLQTTGGSGSYEYSVDATTKLDAAATWRSSSTFEGLAPGTYKFSVRDLSTAACEKIQTISVTIDEPTDIVITENTLLKVNVGCTPCTEDVDCEGSATITITGGTPDFTTYPGVGYKIEWSTGGTGLTETGMPVGLHSVLVTDGNGCTQSINVEIFSNNPITLTEVSSEHTDNECNGGSSGSFVVIATGGSGVYQFNINDPSTSPSTWVDSNFGGLVAEYERSGLAAGSYDIWVRDKNTNYQRCITQITVPIEITQPDALALLVESQTEMTCNAADDATAIVRASGGSGSYEFTTDDPSTVASPTWNAATDGTDGYNLTALSAGTHDVWVRDANATSCSYGTVAVDIDDIDVLDYTLVEHTNVSCNLGNDGRLEVLATGGSGNYVYQWRNSAGTIISTDEYAENLTVADGPYELTITDLPNSCGPVTESFNITEPSTALTVAEINTVDAACGVLASGEITISVSGGTAPYSITWSNGTTDVETVTGLVPGDYSVYVEDANGCTFDNSSTPWVISKLADITLVNPVTLTHNDCYGATDGTLTAEVQGGAGLYEFRLEGPEIRDWTTPIPSSNNLYTFTNLLAGDYTLKVRDANNTSCEYTLGTYSISQPDELTLTYNVSEVVNVSCNGNSDGSIKVYASGGSGDYDYSLDNGATWTNAVQSSIYTFTGLAKGTYYIKVKDINVGTCIGTTTLTVDITQPDKLIIAGTSVTSPSCYSTNDGTITIAAQGGSGNYDYYCVETGAWQTSNVFTLPVGSYTFMIQDSDVPGCTSAISDVVSLIGPLDFTTTSTVTSITCFGADDGKIVFKTTYSNGSGGVFEYSTDGVTFQPSPLTGLAPDVYTITVLDVNSGCEKVLSTSITVTEPDELTQSQTLLQNVTCNGGTDGEVMISVSGGTGSYSYQWSGVTDADGGKTNHIQNLEAGDYEVSITDDNGCAILPVPTYSVTEPDEIIADYASTHIAIGGQSTGSILINTITGGPTTNYSVVWDDGSTGMSRTNLPAGDYSFTVYVKDGAGVTLCSKYYEVTLIDLSATLDFELVATDALCYGDDGNIEVKINSGNPDYTITWYKTGVSQGNIVTSNIISNIAVVAGNYEVNVTDNVGATITKTISVGQPDEFAMSVNIADDIECYEDDATLSLSVTGDAWDNATAPKGDNFTVEWMDPDGLTFGVGTVTAEGVQSGLAKPGTYKAKVYNNTYPDCYQEYSLELSDPDPLGITYTVQDVTCNGGSNGSIAITPTGRPSGHGFTYSWQVSYDGGTTWGALSDNTATIKDKPAALYEVSIQSTSSSCSYTSDAIEIGEPDIIEALVTNTNVLTCYGDNSATIQLTNISGGTMPFKYELNGVETQLASGIINTSIDNLTSQAYTLVIKDVNGCESGIYSVNITEPAELVVDVTTATIDCDDETSGSIVFTIEGGREDASGDQNYSVIVSPDGEADIVIGNVTNSTGAALTINSALLQNLAPNTYTIKVTDLNSNAVEKCLLTEDVNLELIEVTADVTNATCYGVNNGAISNISITGTSGDYSFTWASADGGTGYDNTNLDQAGLSAGTYTLSVTDNVRTCTVDFDFVVDYDHTVTITGDVTDVICSGESSAAINISVSDGGVGTSYLWTGPSGFTFSDATTEDQGQLIAGTYTVTIETTLDSEQCIASESFTINEPDAITFNSYFENTSCDPYQRTLVVDNVSGGTGAYDYIWNGPAFSPAVPVDPTSVLITQGGTYSITVQDKNLCETSNEVVVPDEISIDPVINSVTCNGGNSGSIVLNVSGGSESYTFSWSGPSGFTSTDRNIDNLYAGDYTVTITDVNENDGSGYCNKVYTLTVEEPSTIQIDPSVVHNTCYGTSTGQIEIEVSGGTAPYEYSWTPVVGSNLSSDRDQYNLPADTYTVTVTDDAGCTGIANIDVEQDDEIILSTVATETLCDGTSGEIDLTVSGGSGSGFTYDWSTSDGSGIVQGSQDQTGLLGGTYTVVVSDSGDGRSCTATTSETLTHAISISNISVTNVTCSGNDDGAISYEVNGGDGNYTYAWTTISGDDSRIVADSQDQNGLSEGTYQVVITDGRTDPASTDCSFTYTFNVIAENTLVVNVAVSNSKMCYNEATASLTAVVSGGSGNYQYLWDNVVGTNVLENITQGTYQLEVIDLTYGCNWVQSYEVEGPSAPLSIDDINVTNVLCYGEATGAIEVTVSGGTIGAGYTYTWSGPSVATGSNPTDLVAGTYNLTVTDANSCVVTSGDITITQPASYISVSNAVVTDVSVVGATTGEIQVTIAGGTSPYTIAWYDASNNLVGTTNPLSNIGAGTYRVVVTDNNSCSAELTNIKVVEPGEDLAFEKVVHQISPCNGENNGEINISRVYGGYPINDTYYRIQVSGPGVSEDVNATSLSLTDLQAGDYIVTITDNVPVTITETITITQPDILSISTTKISDVDCYTGTTGEIEVTVSGGTPDASGYYLVTIVSDEGYSSSKNNVEENVAFSFANLPAGNYTITVKDHADDFDTKVPNRGNCEASDTKLITQPEASVELSSVSGSKTICNGDDFILAINTTDWDFSTEGNLTIAVYDGFSTTEYSVDETPYEITVNPSTSRTYQITKVADPSNSTCLKGETTGSKVQVTVNTLPTANISGSSEICEDGAAELSVTLTGAKPFSVTWVDNNNGTSNTEAVDAYTYTFSDSPVSTPQYQILNITDNNGCSNSGNGTVEVIINDKPEVTLTGSTSICAGDQATLNINFITGESPYTITYEANGVEGTLVVVPTGAIYSWIVNPTETTDYEITSVVDANGCSMDFVTPVTAKVIVNQLPETIESINSLTDIDGVCQGTSGVDYYITPVDYATSYIWTAPTGVSIISGIGTASITVDIDEAFTGGYLTVYAHNSCGDGATTEKWIQANELPEEMTSAPSGPTNLCEGATGLVYSITPVANATSYEWYLPTGFVLNGDGTGSSILVDLDPLVPSTVDVIKVRPINDCTTTEEWSPELTVTVTALPVADAGSDERVCSTTHTLNAAAVGTNETGEWTVISGSAQFYNNSDKQTVNPDIYNLSQGENIFVWTVTNTVSGCYTTDTVVINNDQLTLTAMVDQTPVCSGEATITGTALTSLVDADEGFWNFTSGGGSFGDASSNSTTVSNLDLGDNVIRWTVRKNTCESYAEVTVVNNQASESIIYNESGTKVSLIDLECQTDYVSISGSTPLADETGYWRVESGSVTIDDANSASINITNISKGDNELSWNIQKGACVAKSYITIRNNALDVDAGIDRYTCDGTDELYGTPPDTNDGVTGVWTTNNGATFEDAQTYNTEVYNLASGDNLFRWTLTRNGCQSYAEVTIRNDEPSEATIIGDVEEVEICGDEYDMVAKAPTNEGDVGVWSVVSGSGVFEDSTDPNTHVSGIGLGENIFRWTVSNTACQSTVDFTITNLKVEAYAGVDQAVCARTADLNATSPELGTGEWNVVPGEGEATFYPSRLVNNPSIGGMQYGENRFVWTVTYEGCVSRDTVTISANVPNPVDAGADQSILSTSAQLDATQPDYGTGTWTLVEGGGSISDPTILNPIVTDVRRGENIFRWTVDFNGCTDYDEVIISNGTTIDADAGVDQIVCDNEATLEANDPDVGIGEWTVKEGTGVFENIRDPESKVTNLAQGDNIFIWTIYYTNSTSTDEVTITCNKPSDAVAGLDVRVCGDEFELEAKPPVYGTALWTILSGGGVFDDNTDANTIVRSLAPGENILKLTIDNEGCQSTDTVTVYNDTPSIADAGSDQTVCTDSVEMKPVTPQYGDGSWKVVKGQGTGADGGEITGRWIYNLAPGENIFEWVVKVDDASSTCVSRDSVTIINNQPTTSYAGQDRSVCTETTTLSAGEAIYGIGTWELVSGSGTIAEINNRTTEVSGLAKGKNRFRWTIDNEGCTSVSEVQISYDLLEADAGYDPEALCTDTIVLDANEATPGIGEWGIIGGSGSASFDNVNDPYTTARNLDRGTNQLTWTISYKACKSTDTITVVNDMPSTAIAGNNIATCDSSVVLGASVPTIGEGVWTIQNGGGEFVDVTSETTRVNNLQFGNNIFRWTVNYNACSSYDDVQVAYNRINSNITEDYLEICTDEQILSGNNASPGVGEWTVVSGNSQAKFEDNNDPTTNVYDLARGSNLLEWKIEYEGCVTRDTVTIINHNPSTAYAGATQELCSDETTLRATTPAIGTGTWTILSGSATIADSELHNPTAQITDLSKGENTLLWTVLSDNEMCSNTDQVTIYNNTPSIPYAGEDDEYCSPTVTLKAATPDYGTGMWTIKEGAGNFDDPTLPGATVTNLQEGDNTFVWTVSVQNINGDIGCSDSDEVTITNNTPSTANAGPDIEDCKDYNYLDANTPTQGTGSWSVVSGSGTFTDVNDPKTYIEGLSFGENLLQWKIQNGNCTSVDEVVVFNMIPTQSDAGVDKSTCDDYYSLNANTPVYGEGTWTVVSGKGEFDDANDPTTVVRGLGLGENTLKWTIAYGDCTTEDEVMIQSNKADPYAGEDDISYESSYALKASNPGTQTAQWSVVAGTGDFDDDTYYNTTVYNLTEGLNTFRWTMDVEGCISYDDVSIEYRVVPDAAFTADYYNGCYPLDVQFTNHSVGGSSFEWDFGDGSVVSTDRNASHTFESPGVFTVTLTVPGPDDVNGVATQEITVYDHPIADLYYGPETIYAPSGELDCRSVSVDAETYLWDFGDGGTSEEVNPRYTYEEEGVYSISLEVWNQYGCSDDTIVVDAVTVINEGFLTFPTAFTPRPDGGSSSISSGVNDNSLFRPVYKDIDTYKLQIFNRWGQLIYESTDIDEGWNGFFNNQLAPQAVYVWKVSGTYNSGRNFNKTGSVLLVR